MVLLHLALQGFRQVGQVFGHLAIRRDIAVGVDDRHLLVQVRQVLHVVGHGQVGHFGGQDAQVVGGEHDVLRFRDIVVCPDHEGGHVLPLGLFHGQVVRALAKQLLIEGSGELALVVAEEDNHGGLVHLAIVVDELFQGVVRLAHERQVLLRIAAGTEHGALQSDGAGQVVPALVVAAVVLHGDVEDEVLLPLPLLRDGLDGLEVAGVGDIAADILRIGHVGVEHLLVKAHVLVHQRPIPAGRQVGVEGGGVVAHGLGQGDQGRLVILDVELVGHGAAGQEGGAVAGEELVFHVGGAAAGDGRVHPALDGVVLQALEEGDDLLVDLEPVVDAHICKALVHDADEVGGLDAAGDGTAAGLTGLAGTLFQEGVLLQVHLRVLVGVGAGHLLGLVGDGLFGIVIRFIHPTVAQGDGEV